LSSFRDMIASLPGPLSKTTSVETCGEAFVKGIEGRKRQINCPGWVAVFRWLRPVLATSIGGKLLAKDVPERLAEMDSEAAALGRSMSARTEELENH